MKLSFLKQVFVVALGLSATLAMAAPFKVVTTFTVIQDIAQNVAGDKAVVESITKPGAEIHDYQPTPKDIAKAQKADQVKHPSRR
ncbi:metal ABC transporter solute-binding protein, Zn/Mn family, partial [Actinobacillus pleuropneumoniae]|uniref:metal ABC transporter solute-binding protein, Zn/Mn family n=1 Tax=Actinobacillus pleuropneumoniae TaxID=715 RepID=UPI003F7C5D26